jgi:FHA domain
MARLQNVLDGRICLLEPEHLVGRSALCALQLDVAYVSAQHAAFRWMGDRWELRDLGSRNGTFIDGIRMSERTPSTLARGASVTFGKPDQCWVLASDDPPGASVTPLDGGEPIVIDGDLLALPSPDDPQATIFRGPNGVWSLERPDEILMPLDNQTRFSVAGRSFRFSCPVFVPRTATSEQRRDVGLLRLFFQVSRDEEHVELRAQDPSGSSFALGSRLHNYVLLTLARLRKADRPRGLPESACGWVYQEDLVKDLATTSGQLAVDIFRIRKQFATLGLQDSWNIIERRPRAHQLRIGISDFEITTI